MTGPGTVIQRGANAPGGAMVVSEESVMAYVSAYTKYAERLDTLIGNIQISTNRSKYGNLESLRQLADGYYDLMHTGDESLLGRLSQFRDQAREIAQKILDDWQTFKDEDAAISASLNATGLP